jgi:hypothetical protein
MIWAAAGAVLLLVVLGSFQAFSSATVAQVKLAIAWTAGLLGAVLLVVLLLTGRAGQTFWVLALFGPLAWRWWKANRLAAGFGAPQPEPDTVETAMLSMRLDPVSGTLSGRVLKGQQAGRDLSALTAEDLRALLAEAAAQDPESVPLLEAWLDRAHPGWRAAGRKPASAPSARAEALAVLGLPEGATEADIRAAHARLMRAAHPDAGGSDWLAARLNAARDVLLG